jgi:hypothetical protein
MADVASTLCQDVRPVGLAQGSRGLLDRTVDFGIVRKSAMVQPLKFHPLGKFGAVTPRYPHRGCAGTG